MVECIIIIDYFIFEGTKNKQKFEEGEKHFLFLWEILGKCSISHLSKYKFDINESKGLHCPLQVMIEMNIQKVLI